VQQLLSPLLRTALTLIAVACTSDTPTQPVDEQSLVLAYTFESASSCHVVLSSLDGHSRSIENSCGTAVAWSPGGTRLALSRAGGEAAPPSLWIINVDGSGETEVPGGRALADPEWSPDGTQLAAVRLSDGTLEVTRVDGSQHTSFAAASGLGYDRPSWSPDGSEILFSRFDTLWVVNVSSGVARVQCVPGLRQMMGARWSPDGTRISVDADAPNRAGIYVMNADCSNQLLIADGSIDGGWASWSPDGTQVVFASALGDGTTLDVFVAASDGSSAPRNLTNNANGHASFMPDWARAR